MKVLLCIAVLVAVALAADKKLTTDFERPPPKYYYHKKICPKGYTANFNNTSCYKFVNKGTTWVQAWHECRDDGAFLVSIETHDEQKHLVDVLESNAELQRPDYPTVYYWGYWTSGNDIEKDGDYRWAANGLSFRKTFWNFAHSQPNNNYWGIAEMCVNIVKKWSWQWNDLACFDNFNGYICEKQFCPDCHYGYNYHGYHNRPHHPHS